MKPALSQVCSLNSPFESDVADYRAGACDAIEIWLGKLEGYLESHSLDDARRLLDEHAMAVPVASFQGGLLMSQGEARREHWELFARRLEVCHHLGTRVLVVAGDLSEPLGPQDLERVRVSLVQAARQAAKYDVRLALEFQAQAKFANNLPTAVALIEECPEPNVGICFDVFHYYTGSSKLEDLALLGPENLFHVQLSDLAGLPREVATASDRILPGDGDFQLEPILDHFRRIAYRGYVSIEVMNPQIWQIPALQFGEIGMTALRKLLGQASME